MSDERWRRGPEELPAYDVTVLVWRDGHYKLAERRTPMGNALDSWEETSGDGYEEPWSTSELTWWMPLPEPPK